MSQICLAVFIYCHSQHRRPVVNANIQETCFFSGSPGDSQKSVRVSWYKNTNCIVLPENVMVTWCVPTVVRSLRGLHCCLPLLLDTILGPYTALIVQRNVCLWFSNEIAILPLHRPYSPIRDTFVVICDIYKTRRMTNVTLYLASPRTSCYSATS